MSTNEINETEAVAAALADNPTEPVVEEPAVTPDVKPAKAPVTTKQYKVLCWGACADNAKFPCRISYITTAGKERTAVTGNVVDDIPISEIGKPGQEEYHNFIIGRHIELVED